MRSFLINPLWRNADFRSLWIARSISSFGSLMGALPLTALVYLDASVQEMGLLAAATSTPVLMFALPIGVWIDRLPRRLLMVGADLGRFVLLATVPSAVVIGRLQIEHLLGGARVACLSSFYRFLIRMKVVASNPCDALERPKVTQGGARGLSGEQIHRLLDVMPATPVGLRDRAIILTLTSQAGAAQRCWA